MERFTWPLVLAALSGIAGFGWPSLAQARSDVCRTTSRLALFSCQADARSDKLLALGDTEIQ